MSERDRDDRLDDSERLMKEHLLDSIAAPPPPSGFAERVVGEWKLREEPPRAEAPQPRRWRAPLVAALAAAASVSALIYAIEHWPMAPSTGSLNARQRQQLRIGNRAVAVAEPGASLTWKVERGGDTRIEQSAGRVFYRVASGGTFQVHTPAGRAQALGTCFTVEVKQMKLQNPLRSKTLRGALLGSALTGLVVMVYEGQVSVREAGATVRLGPGEKSRNPRGEAPVKVEPSSATKSTAASAAKTNELRRLRDENRILKTRVARFQENLAAGTKAPARVRALAQENDRLRTELRKTRSLLKTEHQIRKEQEGDAIPFPEGIDERYRQNALLRNLTTAFKDSGVNGEVRSIDCSEYPCIAYGEVKAAGTAQLDAAMRKAEEFIRRSYPSPENHLHTSLWSKRTGKEGDRDTPGHFGIAVVPKTDSDIKPSKLRKRLRFRQSQYTETLRP